MRCASLSTNAFEIFKDSTLVIAVHEYTLFFRCIYYLLFNFISPSLRARADEVSRVPKLSVRYFSFFDCFRMIPPRQRTRLRAREAIAARRASGRRERALWREFLVKINCENVSFVISLVLMNRAPNELDSTNDAIAPAGPEMPRCWVATIQAFATDTHERC